MTVQIFEHKIVPPQIDDYLYMAESKYGLYAVNSERRGIGYLMDKGEIAIITTKGVMRIDYKSAKTIFTEVLALVDDAVDFKRMRLVKRKETR